MPIVHVPFLPVDVVFDETRTTKYQRIGFFTLSDISPTVHLNVDFIPHPDDIYDDLCVGVVIRSAVTYGRLSELNVEELSPWITSKGNWVRRGLQNTPDAHALYIYKFYATGPQFRSLRNFTRDMRNQWADWVVFAGIHRRDDVTMRITHAQGTVKIIQALSIPFERIFSAASNERLYLEADKEDTRGRQIRRVEHEKDQQERLAQRADEILT